jgi:hypothetical protein
MSCDVNAGFSSGVSSGMSLVERREDAARRARNLLGVSVGDFVALKNNPQIMFEVKGLWNEKVLAFSLRTDDLGPIPSLFKGGANMELTDSPNLLKIFGEEEQRTLLIKV